MFPVIFLLETGPQPTDTGPVLAEAPSFAEWQRAKARRMLARIAEAVKDTLVELRALGLEPRSWELGQALVLGPASAIAEAIALPGVRAAVLDRPLGEPESWKPIAHPSPQGADCLGLADHSLGEGPLNSEV